MTLHSRKTTRLSLALLCLSVLLAAGCSRKDAAAGATKNVPAFQGPVLAALKSAQLTPGEFEVTAAKPYQARSCVRGQVDRLDVMLCDYPDEPTAKNAEPSLLQFVAGAGSGAVRRAGTLALAAADRHRVDPEGKTLNHLLQVFSKK